MTTVNQGAQVTLLSQWSEYPGGPAADLTGVTITITRIAGSTVVVGPTSTGVSHPATGVYTYTWTVPVSQAPGDYLAAWSGVDAQSDMVSATEVVSVLGPGDGGGYATRRLSTTVTGTSGLVDPATITVEVLLPSGSVAGPFTPVRDSLGVYHYDYTPATAGRHIARWITTTPSGVDEDPFEVIAAWAGAGVVSLADAKAHLNITTATDDEEIQGFIRSATEVCERYAGALVRTTHTQRCDAGYGIALNHTPILLVISITPVRSGGTAPTLADLDVDTATGVIHRLDGRRISGPLIVTYTAGRAAIPPHVRLAALIIIEHLWETQRGQQGGVSYGGSGEGWDPRLGFAIPRRALELLGPQVSGIA